MAVEPAGSNSLLKTTSPLTDSLRGALREFGSPDSNCGIRCVRDRLTAESLVCDSSHARFPSVREARAQLPIKLYQVPRSLCGRATSVKLHFD